MPLECGGSFSVNEIVGKWSGKGGPNTRLRRLIALCSFLQLQDLDLAYSIVGLTHPFGFIGSKEFSYLISCHKRYPC